MKYFMENTNATNTASAKDVIEHLGTLGIKAERKAIYKDIEADEQFEKYFSEDGIKKVEQKSLSDM